MEELYIARDKNGALYLYEEKPYKPTQDYWTASSLNYFSIDDNLFPEVKWEDEETTKVKLEITKID